MEFDLEVEGEQFDQLLERRDRVARQADHLDVVPDRDVKVVEANLAELKRVEAFVPVCVVYLYAVVRPLLLYDVVGQQYTANGYLTGAEAKELWVKNLEEADLQRQLLYLVQVIFFQINNF